MNFLLFQIPIGAIISFYIGNRIIKRKSKGRKLNTAESVNKIFLSIGLFFICIIPWIGIPKVAVSLKTMFNNDAVVSEVIDVVKETKTDNEGVKNTFYYPIVKYEFAKEKNEIRQKLNIGSTVNPKIGEKIEVVYNKESGELYSVSLSSISMTVFSLFVMLIMSIVFIYACMYAFNTSIKPQVFQSVIVGFLVIPSIFIGGIIVSLYYLYLCFIVNKYETYNWGTIITAICVLIVLIAKTPVLIKDIRRIAQKNQ